MRLSSSSELLEHRSAWNDLWLRSECTWPTMRAEPLAQWLDTFARGSRLAILIVQDEGKFLAALPLYERRLGPARIGTLPGGDLCSVGDLLCDASESVSQIMQVLVEGIRQLRWPLLRFDAMFPESRRWKEFLQATQRNRMTSVARHRGVTGLIDITGSWEAYFAGRSRNHRRHMRVVRQKADREGKLSLQLVANPGVNEIEPLLHRGFEVEDRSWKSVAGTSTLRTPVAFEYFCKQAELLSASGYLQLAFLELDGNAIAFEYGWQAKGVYHSLKVGYDEAYSHLSPGQLLRAMMLEQFFADGEISLVDYLGPLSDATGKWTTRTYPVAKLFLANGVVGKLLLKAYETCRPASQHGCAASSSAASELPKCETAAS